jgi:hypothetical protein
MDLHIRCCALLRSITQAFQKYVAEKKEETPEVVPVVTKRVYFPNIPRSVPLSVVLTGIVCFGVGLMLTGVRVRKF